MFLCLSTISLQMYLSKKGNLNYWIGLSQVGTNEWTWINNTVLTVRWGKIVTENTLKGNVKKNKFFPLPVARGAWFSVVCNGKPGKIQECFAYFLLLQQKNINKIINKLKEALAVFLHLTLQASMNNSSYGYKNKQVL